MGMSRGWVVCPLLPFKLVFGSREHHNAGQRASQEAAASLIKVTTSACNNDLPGLVRLAMLVMFSAITIAKPLADR